MKDLRNPELRRELSWYGALTLALTVGVWFLSPWAALVVFLGGTAFTLLHWWFVHWRYQALADLSREVDRVLHDPAGSPINEGEEGELAILHSEIRKMNLRLRESLDLLQQDKLRLSEAVADISHQLRTPLTSMNLAVSLLRQEGQDPDRRLALTRDLQRDLQRIDWLVETLLKLSKLDAGTAVFTRETVSVRDLIHRATAQLLIPMELRDQTLAVTVGEETFLGDPAWSAEALGNLVKNCVEHTPAGGTVTVEALENSLYTQITVRDTGPGFAPEDLPHLFERFYRGQNAAPESVGIGLALARSIAAAQNGTLKAENGPDGAVFTLRFYRGII